MIQRISTRTIDNMKRKSALSLQNKTYTSGMSPQMIKEYFVNLITDSDNSALSELTRVINEANESFVDKNSLGAVSGVATLGENGKVLPAQLPHIPSESDYIPQTDKGVNVATLENGKIPSTQLPSYVDDTLEGVLSGGSFLVGGVAIIPETGKIYVDTNTNLTYRWSGSVFAEISPSLALGENETTAFSGARGKVLETKVGSGTLQTSSQTLIGAINEILELGVVITNWSVSKEGLNNNHTVTFNDGTTFTFTVTDGAKGKGYNPRWGWEIGKEYSNNDVQIDTAFYNGTTYACKLTHTSDSTNTPPNAMYWDVLATGVNPASDINKVTAVNVVGESVTINNTNDGYVDEITLEGNTIGGNGTPETPIAIQSVESPVALVNCGKNIFRASEYLASYNTSYVKNSDNQITITSTKSANDTKYTAMKLGTIPQGNYYLSFVKSENCENIIIYAQNALNTGIPIGGSVNAKAIKAFFTNGTLTIPSGYVAFYALFYLKAVTALGDTGVFSNLQLEKGSTATEDEPYQGTTLSIPINDTNGNDITLRRAGTAYDSVYKENGKWYLRKAINEQVLNGSENWKVTEDRFWIIMTDIEAPANMDNIPNLIATTHPTKTYNQVVSGGESGVYLQRGGIGGSFLGVRDTVTFAGFTVANLKTWLGTHNITIAYELATPEIIELHEDTATALESLKTYQGTTNIFGANTVNPILDVTELAMGIGEKKYALLIDSNGNSVMPVNEADNVILSDGKTVEKAIIAMCKIIESSISTTSAITLVKQPNITYILFNATAGENILHLASGTGLSFTINKGDGTEDIGGNPLGGNHPLSYNKAGRYLISIYGTFNGVYVNDQDGKLKYIEAYLGTNCKCGKESFFGCSNLLKVEFASEWAYTIIEQNAFRNCVSLEYIEIPSSVTTLGHHAFNESGLTSIEIPATVTTVGNYSFYKCYELKYLTVDKSIESVLPNDFNKIFTDVRTIIRIIKGKPTETQKDSILALFDKQGMGRFGYDVATRCYY